MSCFSFYGFLVFGFVSPAAEKGSRFGWVRFNLPGDGPDKAGEFARHGRNGHLGLFLAHAREVVVAVMQSSLGLPGNVGNGFGQNLPGAFLSEDSGEPERDIARPLRPGRGGREHCPFW